jgi:hypothetical protein
VEWDNIYDYCERFSSALFSWNIIVVHLELCITWEYQQLCQLRRWSGWVICTKSGYNIVSLLLLTRQNNIETLDGYKKTMIAKNDPMIYLDLPNGGQLFVQSTLGYKTKDAIASSNSNNTNSNNANSNNTNSNNTNSTCASFEQGIFRLTKVDLQRGRWAIRQGFWQVDLLVLL